MSPMTSDDWPDATTMTGERLELEPLRVEHAIELAPVLAHPELYAFTGGEPPTTDQLTERYRHQVVGRSSDGSQRWLNWVVRRRADRVAVGYVQATVGAEEIEVAWLIGVEHQGHGYATEATSLMAEGLRRHGARPLVAHVHPDHRASMRVARSIGLVSTEIVLDGEVRWQSPAQ
ncbi:conserved hypothetical protein [metagenome]|uniref:N-acetyltransferase domain-containing protein n=1 Tax=metagenome TaxID=256318 RepID=A0A2P2BXW4_9ZZZZ